LAGYLGSPSGVFVFATIVNVLSALLVASGMRRTLLFHRGSFVIAFIGTVVAIFVVALTTNSQFVADLAKYGVNYNNVIQSANSSGAFALTSNWNQLGPTVLGIGFASTALIFFQFTTYVGGEVRNTKRSAPIALIGSLLILTGLMLLVAYGIASTFGSQFLGSLYGLFSSGSSSYPMGSVPPSYTLFASVIAGNNTVLLYLMGLGLVIWSIAIVPLMYLTMSRNVMAWGFDRVLPSWFSNVNDRLKSPVNAIIFTFVVSQIFLIPLAFLPIFTTIFSSGLIGFVIDYLVVSIAAVAFPFVKKDLYQRTGLSGYKIASLPLTGVAGVISAIFMVLLMYGILTNPGFAIYNPSNPVTTVIDYGIAFSVFIVGIAIFYVSKSARKSKGIDLSLAFRDLPPE
jgi:amino acid transporter